DNPSLYTPNNGAPNWSFTNNSTRVEVSFFRPRDTSPLGQRNKIDNFVFYSEADGVTVSTPTFSPAQGTYSDAQTASISTATTDATIRYTINGTDPTESSTIYTNPITISNTTTVKAIAYKSGFTPSDIATATYTITAPSDTTPPNISDGSPSGTIAYDATQTNLTITTDENATCKYSTTQNTEYSSISNTFTTTSSANHSTQIINLTSGSSHTYYIRCIDASDNANANTSDYTISFSVASAPSNPSGGGTTLASDTTPPAKVTNFTASAGDQEIVLTWKNPTDSDFVRTKILRKEDNYSANSGDGELIYDGNEETYTDTGLTNNTAYYYSVFTYDEIPNYSDSAAASATPEEGKTPDPPSLDPDP
ncbi:MAG: chitobiase/beta-hexosaminidase C-terminal domain-containing protein, partial [Candidatus Pacebacteria bacterium]|nr:chitobiase/beta-hexosaminidase C-terminal domain-containing protein [Candidatus Paceibacterota bacterium]